MPERRYHDGQRVGLWTLVTAYPNGDSRALCRCECGAEHMVSRTNLGSGVSKGCSACRGGRHGHKMADGDRFGSWRVIAAYPGGTAALCECKCGTRKLVTRGHLQRGLTKGCLACYTDWPSRLIGRRIGPRVVIEVDRDAKQAVMRCDKCAALSVVSTQYVRAKKNVHTRCPRCEVACPRDAVSATGVSRQAIFMRIKNGWTREEAHSMQKGQLPSRIAALRSVHR